MKTKSKLCKDKVGTVIFKEALEGMLIANNKGIIQMANPSLLKMFGHKKNQLIGKKIEVLVPDDHKNKHINNRKNYFKHPVTRPIGDDSGVIGKRRDGTVFPLELSLNHFKVDGQELVMALVTNSTERGKLIEELKSEKETAETYLQITGTIIVIIDRDHKVKLINNKGCKILGHPKHKIIGKNWFESFIPKKLRKEMKNMFDNVMNSETAIKEHYRNPIITSKGEERIISWHNTFLRDQKGGIIGSLSSGEDVTELIRAQEKLLKLNEQLEYKFQERSRELEESHLLYKTIAKNFPNGVISVLDKNLDYVFIEGKEMHKNDTKNEKLIGASFIDRVDHKMRTRFRNKIKTAFEGENISFEVKSGDKTQMIYLNGLKDKNGKINRILKVSQNITSLKKAEVEIQKSLEKEKTLNELKSRFVSMASHEFQTPLTSILNSAFLLSKLTEQSWSPEKQRKHIERIRNSVHQMSTILNDFLSLDKLEDGKVKIHGSFFNLPEFSRGIVEEMKDVVKYGQQIIYNHTGSTEMFFDKQILKIIYHNLLSNAIKYSPVNSKTSIETAIDHDKLIVKIEDTGIGIPLEDQPHLFERFFRAKNALDIGGTGLGLNIVKKYVDYVDGEINLKSGQDNGTTVIVKLPSNESHYYN